MIELASLPASSHLFALHKPDDGALNEEFQPVRNGGIRLSQWNRVHGALVRIAALPLLLLGGREMRAPDMIRGCKTFRKSVGEP